MAKSLQHDQAALIARISTSSTTDDEPVPDSARSDRTNAITSQTRWYKISVRSDPLTQLKIPVCLAGLMAHEDGANRYDDSGDAFAHQLPVRQFLVSQRRKEYGQDDAEREDEQRCRAADGLHEAQWREQQRVA